MAGKSLCEMRGRVSISTQMEIMTLAMAQDKQSLATSVFFSQFALYVDHLGIDSRFSPTKESLGMPQLEAALSITNTVNPHAFLFFIPVEAAHRPATSSSDLLNLEEELLPQN